jgi:tetratricopeptide (TPR) repeat protein
VGWEAAGSVAADLSAVEEPEPGAGATDEAKFRAYLQRFNFRALHVSLVPTMPNRAGGIEECIAELKKLRALRPDVPQLAMNLHWGYAVLRRDAEAAAVADEFARSGSTEPQSLSYFARAMSARGKYDEALALLARARPLDDYLGDEIALERIRAYGGKNDIQSAIKAYADRIDELKADLDQFHFTYHLAIALDEPRSEYAKLFGRLRHGLELGAPTPEGVPVVKVEPGTPGAEAGLQAGDLIVSAEGKKPELATFPIARKNWETLALKVKRGAETVDAKLKLVSEYLHQVEKLGLARDAEGKRKLIHVLNLAAAYSRLVGEDAQVELLAGAVDEFKHVFGFRHYVYRTAYRIVETGGKDTPD